uniref:Uncharacterized protein n=1 Tax=Rhizophora mucronata TaxID=61149 RepID=A0A2P2NHT7_RHIMU
MLRHPNPNVIPSRRRKRSPGRPQSSPKDLNSRNRSVTRSRPQSQSMGVKSPVKNLVMGQVKILKRGEPLGVLDENRNLRAKSEEDLDLILGCTDRLGPGPETVHKQLRGREINGPVDDVYAGTAFVASPQPTSLPVPGFLGKGFRRKGSK